MKRAIRTREGALDSAVTKVFRDAGTNVPSSLAGEFQELASELELVDREVRARRVGLRDPRMPKLILLVGVLLGAAATLLVLMLVFGATPEETRSDPAIVAASPPQESATGPRPQEPRATTETPATEETKLPAAPVAASAPALERATSDPEREELIELAGEVVGLARSGDEAGRAAALKKVAALRVRADGKNLDVVEKCEAKVRELLEAASANAPPPEPAVVESLKNAASDPTVSEWLKLAKAAVEKKDRVAAVAFYAKVLERDPGNVDALCERATIFVAEKNYEAAQADAERAVQAHPEVDRSWRQLTWVRSSRGQYAEALTVATLGLEKHPESARLHYLRGVAHASLAAWDKADADLSKSLALDARRADTWTERGWIRLNLAQNDASIADLSKAVELDPKQVWAWVDLGCAYVRKEDYARALSTSTTAIELDPKIAASYVNRGIAHARLGHRAEALADLERAQSLGPSANEAALIQQELAKLSDKPDRGRAGREAYEKLYDKWSKIRADKSLTDLQRGNAMKALKAQYVGKRIVLSLKVVNVSDESADGKGKRYGVSGRVWEDRVLTFHFYDASDFARLAKTDRGATIYFETTLVLSAGPGSDEPGFTDHKLK